MCVISYNTTQSQYNLSVHKLVQYNTVCARTKSCCMIYNTQIVFLVLAVVAARQLWTPRPLLSTTTTLSTANTICAHTKSCCMIYNTHIVFLVLRRYLGAQKLFGCLELFWCSELSWSWEFSSKQEYHLSCYCLQCGEDAEDALSCRSLSAKEPSIVGLFYRIWPVKIRHPVHLRHPVRRC